MLTWPHVQSFPLFAFAWPPYLGLIVPHTKFLRRFEGQHPENVPDILKEVPKLTRDVLCFAEDTAGTTKGSGSLGAAKEPSVPPPSPYCAQCASFLRVSPACGWGEWANSQQGFCMENLLLIMFGNYNSKSDIVFTCLRYWLDHSKSAPSVFHAAYPELLDHLYPQLDFHASTACSRIATSKKIKWCCMFRLWGLSEMPLSDAERMVVKNASLFCI